MILSIASAMSCNKLEQHWEKKRRKVALDHIGYARANKIYSRKIGLKVGDNNSGEH